MQSSSVMCSCPCCGTVVAHVPFPAYMRCALCQHRWRLPPQQAGERHYETLVARNDPYSPWFRRKIAERHAWLSSLLGSDVQRILEIGCAEGELGKQIKHGRGVTYDGIELSLDRETACHHLDTVHPVPAAQIDAAGYDLIVSFHVLEHIVDLDAEIAAWRRLLNDSGKMLIEVPNQAGHPLLCSDANPEHMHQFTAVSLMLLLSRAGLNCQQLSLGHYESPVYQDSIRLLARPRPDDSSSRTALLQRFTQRIGGPFIACGIGGDFNNYVLPLAGALPINALVDSSSTKWGSEVAGLTISGFDLQRHGSFPLLICSLKFGPAIRQHLLDLGVAADQLITLEEIYEGERQ